MPITTPAPVIPPPPPPAAPPPVPPSSVFTAEQVNAAYIDILGRPVDAGAAAAAANDPNLRADLAYSAEAANNVATVWANILDRGIDQTALSSFQNQLAAGQTTVAEIRNYLAYSPEAQSRLSTIFQNVFNRPIDSANVSAVQAALANGTMTQQSFQTYFANTPEVAQRIRQYFQDTLGRPIDPAGLNTIVAALAGGSTLQSFRTYWAQSPESQANIATAYSNMLGRPATAEDLAANTSNLANGSTTLLGIRTLVANSAEAQNGLVSTYLALLGRLANPVELIGDVSNLLAGFSTQLSIRTAIAYSPEAQGDVSQTYSFILGRAPISAEITNESGDLASGASTLVSFKTVLGNTSEAQVLYGDAYTSLYGAAPTPSQLGQFSTTLIAGGLHDTISSFLQQVIADSHSKMRDQVAANATQLGGQNAPNFAGYVDGTQSSPNTGSLVLSSDPNEYNTAVPLIDSNGNQLSDARGPIMRPENFSPAFFHDRGLHDAPIYQAANMAYGLAQSDPTNYLLVDAVLLQTPVSLFNRGGLWDAQRLNGVTYQQYISDASVNIGVYAKAAGLPLDLVLHVNDDFQHYLGGARPPLDSVYTHSSAVIIEDITKGYNNLY